MCTLTSANVARTCRTIESPMTTASRSVSQRGAKRLRDEMSKTGGGEVVYWGLDHIFCCCTQGPEFRSVSSMLHTYPGLDVSSVAFRFLSWACFPSSSWIRLSMASSSSCIECSSNVSSPALKGRHKSAIKASNSETMVNVCMCVCL